MPSLQPRRTSGKWAVWSALVTMVLLVAIMMFAGLGLCMGGGCGNRNLPKIFIGLGRVVQVGVLAGLITTASLAIWAHCLRPRQPKPPERSAGRLAIRSALVTVILCVVFFLLQSKGNCPEYADRCADDTAIYGALSWVAYAAFLAGLIATVFLTILALLRHRARRRQSPRPAPQPAPGERPYSHWTAWSAVTTWLLLVGSFMFFGQAFCITGCGSAQRSAGQLFHVSWVGFLTGVMVTTVLAIRALTLHRQDNKALLSLVAVVLPFVLLGGPIMLAFS